MLIKTRTCNHEFVDLLLKMTLSTGGSARQYDKFVAMSHAFDDADSSGVLHLDKLNLFAVLSLVLSSPCYESNAPLCFQIPDRTFEMMHLVHLSLAGNRLEELPVSIGSFRHLASLDVSDNSLRRLPWTLGNLTRLKSLALQGNPFEVPQPHPGACNSVAGSLSGCRATFRHFFPLVRPLMRSVSCELASSMRLLCSQTRAACWRSQSQISRWKRQNTHSEWLTAVGWTQCCWPQVGARDAVRNYFRMASTRLELQ